MTDQRGGFGRPVIGHCDTPPIRSGGVAVITAAFSALGSPLSFVFPLGSPPALSFSTIRPATFALAMKQATQYAYICLSSG
jgi:hypothetical protein